MTTRAPYHDSKFTGIEIKPDKSIVLSFVAYKGEPFETTLWGVEHFCCDNFREGNTIFDRERVGEHGNVIHLEDLDKVTYGREPDFLDDLLKKISSADLQFYKLTSSYGAVVLAVCHRVDEVSE